MSHAAFCVVRRGGRVLAISRGHDVTDWNVPGGKLEAGESFQQGALRELREETGVVARIGDLRQVMHIRRPTGEVAFFEVLRCKIPDALRSVPFEGHVDWLPPEGLLSSGCRHRDHALVLLARVGALGPDVVPR